MHIEKRGVRITGIPTVTVIEAVPGEGITIKGISPDAHYSTNEIIELRDGLNAALDAMGEVTPLSEGPWARIEDVPERCFPVLDREGDSWSLFEIHDRQKEGGWKVAQVNSYAPFRRHES